MKRRLIKAIKIAIIILIAATLVFSLIASQDEHHLETCHEEHCAHCTIIQIAQSIICISIAVVIAIVIGALIYMFLARLHKEQEIFIQDSLVFQKVQLNE
jgi:uncharacterized membrane protein YdjX (TVP38/TMEM64 family)